LGGGGYFQTPLVRHYREIMRECLPPGGKTQVPRAWDKSRTFYPERFIADFCRNRSDIRARLFRPWGRNAAFANYRWKPTGGRGHRWKSAGRSARVPISVRMFRQAARYETDITIMTRPRFYDNRLLLYYPHGSTATLKRCAVITARK